MEESGRPTGDAAAHSRRQAAPNLPQTPATPALLNQPRLLAAHSPDRDDMPVSGVIASGDAPYSIDAPARAEALAH